MFIETVPFTRNRVLVLMGALLIVALIYILLTSFFVFKESCVTSADLVVFEDLPSNNDREEEPKRKVVFISGFDDSSGMDIIANAIELNPNITCKRTISEIEYILKLYEKVSSLKSLQKEQTFLSYQKVVESLLVEILETSEPLNCYVEPNFLSYGLWQNIPYVRFLFVLEDVRAIAHTTVTQSERTGSERSSSDNSESKPQAIYESVMEDWNRKMFVMNERCDSLGDKCLKIKVEDFFANRWLTMKTMYEFFQLSWKENSGFYKQFPSQRPSM